MKTNILYIALAMGLLFANCKKETNTTTKSATTTTDTVAADAHSHGAGDSEMMASMNGMMDRMHSMEMSGNTDHDLAASMEEHHKSAVEMADILLEKGTDPELKKLAQKIKDEQDKEIAELQKLQGKYKDGPKNYDPRNSGEGLGKAMMADMMAMMKMPESGTQSVDKEFAILMTKHHQDGIQMARSIVQYAQDAGFKTMAQNIIKSQDQGVKVMQQWLAAHP